MQIERGLQVSLQTLNAMRQPWLESCPELSFALSLTLFRPAI